MAGSTKPIDEANISWLAFCCWKPNASAGMLTSMGPDVKMTLESVYRAKSSASCVGGNMANDGSDKVVMMSE